MKLIKIKENNFWIDYIYENNIIKRIWNNGEVYNIEKQSLSRKDRAVIENCFHCKQKECWRKNGNNKYKRHFYLYGKNCSAIEFAEITHHKLCKYCNDFCNQKCFL